MKREVYTLADLHDWPRATHGAAPPLRLAVLGDPVAHSASPPMHDAALVACGIAARYTRLHVRPDELADALRLAARAGFIGVNLTIPHKTAAIPLLDGIDAHAAALGAVNTVRVDEAGRLHGFNTDGPGFEQAVRAEFGVEVSELRVLILGAGGGAGRALAAQCALTGSPRLALVNRTFEKAVALAETLRRSPANKTEISALPWEPSVLSRALQETDLVVNASSLGLEHVPIDSALFSLDVGTALCRRVRADQTRRHSAVPTSKRLTPMGCAPGGLTIPSRLLVFDTVYRADGQPTPLLEAARASGARAVGGKSLLLHQGALAFEHWFAQPAPVHLMRQALEL